MNRSYLSFFLGLSLILLCGGMCPVLANAPATAKIVFNSTRDGNTEIYMMNPDGSQPVRLTDHPARDVAPAWSPTGEQIVFTSDRDGKWDIYIMDVDGTNVRRVGKRLNPHGLQMERNSFINRKSEIIRNSLKSICVRVKPKNSPIVVTIFTPIGLIHRCCPFSQQNRHLQQLGLE